MHVVNRAFQTGHQASERQINRLLRAMYHLFKDVPARRAQYIDATGKSVFPSKFCEIRWTQNTSARKRALDVFDDVIQFVKTVKLPKLTSVDTIKDAVSDPLTKAKLASFVTITQLLEGFLTAFQSNASMAPYLYDDLQEVVKSLMRRCVKPEVIEKAATAAQLMKIDLDDSKNLLS